MYKATVKNEGIEGGKEPFEISFDKNQTYLDGEDFLWDLIEVKKNYFHILKDNCSYRAEVLEVNTETKVVSIMINRQKFSVQLQDRFDLLLDRLGMGQTASARINDIKAPMPGLIHEIQIREGDTVKKGDPIMILEAMKMENVIKSPGEGVIKNIRIKKGDSVEKGQVLITF